MDGTFPWIWREVLEASMGTRLHPLRMVSAPQMARRGRTWKPGKARTWDLRFPKAMQPFAGAWISLALPWASLSPLRPSVETEPTSRTNHSDEARSGDVCAGLLYKQPRCINKTIFLANRGWRTSCMPNNCRNIVKHRAWNRAEISWNIVQKYPETSCMPNDSRNINGSFYRQRFFGHTFGGVLKVFGTGHDDSSFWRPSGLACINAMQYCLQSLHWRAKAGTAFNKSGQIVYICGWICVYN